VKRKKDRQQVFKTPIFIRVFQCLAFCGMFFCLFAQPSFAQSEEEPQTGFFSYLPKAPDIKLPSLDIIPFWTDDLKAGRRAYSKSEFGKARRYFQKSSEDGNMVADWYLGHLYRLGLGVEVDQAVAFSYYQRVADNFDPEEQDNNRLRIMVDGQLRVANYQRTGIPQAHIRPNPQLAARTYLRLATTYAHPGALYALGVMSIEGESMAKNPQQGLKWLNAAVRKRSPDAAAYLADLYQSGTIVKHSETRALMWLIIAAESAKQDENPEIFSKLAERRFSATEEVRLEAEARARVWSEENPVPASP
jgi:uncharacterized protein